ncbi:hypothetical protein D1007_35889 [Hordeum vulgare]|nr:hypothetical protein D1007_35889 [Hordeum vulgare]
MQDAHGVAVASTGDVVEENVAGTMPDACVHGDVRDVATVAAGVATATANLVEKEEEDRVGNKRKIVMIGLKDEYDPRFVDDDVYEVNLLEFLDDVDDGNVDSFIWKEVQKIKDQGKNAYYKRNKFWCPYYTTKPNPKDGLFEHLVSHAQDASKSGEDAKIRAHHASLLKALTPFSSAP